MSEEHTFYEDLREVTAERRSRPGQSRDVVYQAEYKYWLGSLL